MRCPGCGDADRFGERHHPAVIHDGRQTNQEPIPRLVGAADRQVSKVIFQL
jgi:hypothetical protein